MSGSGLSDLFPISQFRMNYLEGHAVCGLIPTQTGLVLISSRKGFQEERDPIRLRDSKSRPLGCYACGGSSIPLRSLTTDPGSTWRQIVSCDYCSLSWHLDCLNPPLATMPNSGRKWMCPNHAEQVMVSFPLVSCSGASDRSDQHVLSLPLRPLRGARRP